MARSQPATVQVEYLAAPSVDTTSRERCGASLECGGHYRRSRGHQATEEGPNPCRVRPLVREGFPLVIDAEQPADDYDDTHTESLIHCWRQEIWALALSRPLPRPYATTALQHAAFLG